MQTKQILAEKVKMISGIKVADAELPYYKDLLIIGGTGRNVGKTTLATMLFNKNSNSKIIALKVSTHRKEEESFHGTHEFYPAENYRIFVETGIQPWKDTARLLSSGASGAFYIEASADKIQEAFDEFMNSYNPEQHPVICESRSLRKHIRPGIFILLASPENSISDFDKERADFIFYSDSNLDDLSQLAERIQLTDNGWKLTQ